MPITKPTTSLMRIMPALVHIQAHLEEDLSLDLLADEVGLSKFHFHQLFRRVTGETPKSYVDRLRLERAALLLRLRRASVLEIALECGFRNHETFSRAFRAHFAMTPREFRKGWNPQDRKRTVARKLTMSDAPSKKLSATRIVKLSRMIVAFIRHWGPYEQVTPDTFKRLIAWSRRRGMADESPVLLGIAHDAPGITPADKLRFDCCIQVPEVFEADRDIACQRTPSGEYAMTDYIGSWDLLPAYSTIIDRLRSHPTVELIGLPAVEIFQATSINTRHSLAQVSIALPVKAR